MKLQQALSLSSRIVELLRPHTSLIHIAGSVRRQKPEVKDIEILCIPNKISLQQNLFGESSNQTVTGGFVMALEQMTREVIKGQTNGRYMQIILKGGATLDLFMPDPDDYYRQLAIRTGSSKYSHEVIAAAWRRKGWVGTDIGLRRIEDSEAKISGEKTTWKCINTNGEKPPVWASEEAFFEWLDIKWIHPVNRDIHIPNLA